MDSVFEQSFRKRQSSEPAPSMQRQLSTRQTSGGDPHPAALASFAPGLLEEEEDELNEDEDDGRPVLAVQGRQDTFSLQDDMGTLGRQVTEVNWPTWGAGAAPLPMGLSGGMFMGAE
eukprot:gb/GFBE01062883.1/.p1 GENE.gb/GFBE01062883.1/~~gb/GFBE01062883.1/.p1  ORF type:complete len:117 (+),score=21.27 gb/GFBE01062883.1/:1-351(+)